MAVLTVKRKLAWTLLVAMGLTASVSSVGCAVRWRDPDMAVKLPYEVSNRDKSTVDLRGTPFAAIALRDARSDLYLYDHKDRTGLPLVETERHRLLLADGADAGSWTSNALMQELQRAGATIEPMPAGTRSTRGRVIMGQVTLLSAEPSGVDVGGWPVALATGMGYKAHISMTLQLEEDGTPILSREYDIQENVPSDPLLVVLAGRVPAYRDVPPAYTKVLKKLLRERVLPDLAQACNGTASIAAETQPDTPTPAVLTEKSSEPHANRE